MHQRISKKIVVYLFLFLTLVTINNINLSDFNFLKIITLNLTGLNNFEKKNFEEDLNFLKKEDLIFLDKDKISKKIFANKIVEDFSVFKNYPSELEIFIKKTKFLAITKKNNQDYYIGSNGNLIYTKNSLERLPFIFGNVEPDDFLKLKTHINNSEFNFDQIKNLYFFKSKRWDIETKDDLIIKLPLDQIEISLNNLSKIIISEEFKNKKIIDLRQKNQVILND
ncbi:cell division protein FtsQ/DivIB [Pelagibacterales bacterium SAG-MED30]|nr:cell division protein FtsQ/DivIB [Pelagibacterales bacterium SAG-MED30]|tara:strand:- start:6963 stop:7634 length:672 start_codon:yes stop_codon:yes gene_type:complete